MSHLTRTTKKSIFETQVAERPASPMGSADREHVNTAVSVGTALVPDETGPYFARLPGQCFDPAMGVSNLPPRTRGKHY